MKEAGMIALSIPEVLHRRHYDLVLRRHISCQLAYLDSWPLFETIHEVGTCTQRLDVLFFALWSLDAPVGRVCSAEVPIPYPRHLEQAALPLEMAWETRSCRWPLTVTATATRSSTISKRCPTSVKLST